MDKGKVVKAAVSFAAMAGLGYLVAKYIVKGDSVNGEKKAGEKGKDCDGCTCGCHVADHYHGHVHHDDDHNGTCDDCGVAVGDGAKGTVGDSTKGGVEAGVEDDRTYLEKAIDAMKGLTEKLNSQFKDTGIDEEAAKEFLESLKETEVKDEAHGEETVPASEKAEQAGEEDLSDEGESESVDGTGTVNDADAEEPADDIDEFADEPVEMDGDDELEDYPEDYE